eukprot:3722724-Pyramimonas_sp.AAC.1
MTMAMMIMMMLMMLLIIMMMNEEGEPLHPTSEQKQTRREALLYGAGAFGDTLPRRQWASTSLAPRDPNLSISAASQVPEGSVSPKWSPQSSG